MSSIQVRVSRDAYAKLVKLQHQLELKYPGRVVTKLLELWEKEKGKIGGKEKNVS